MDKVTVENEIERKFLLSDLPDEIAFGIADRKFKFEEIEQGYVKDGSRIRKTSSPDGRIEYSRTEKEDIPDTDGISKKETTRIITEPEYISLLKKIEGEQIVKTRYFIPFENETLEINLFHGRLEGKVIVEIEFESLDEALAFKKPNFLGRELSSELTNRDLAMGKSIPEN